MEQLPKIARQRMQATARPGVHPDPNQLAAFAEKSLRESERVQVLEHLSQCADCRDVVLLALPEDPAPALIASRPRWLNWPILRWGALAATVIVISAAVTLRHPRQSESVSQLDRAAGNPAIEKQSSRAANETYVAKVAPPTAFESNAASGTAPSSTSPTAPARRELPGATVIGGQTGALQNQVSRISPRTDQPLSESQTTADSLIASPLAKADAASSSRASASANKPASPAGGQMAQAPAAPAYAAQSKNGNMSIQLRAKEMQADQAASQAAETVVIAPAPGTLETETAQIKSKDESKKLQKKDAGAPAASNPASNPSSNLKTAVEIAPSWSLSPTGALQRSFDAGKTWQAIPMPANTVFRALLVRDSDIWAGGAAGALYHSSDAGQTWTQVTPVANGQPLTADIISIEFSDRQTGKLVTAANESWTTSDAGLTWHRH